METLGEEMAGKRISKYKLAKMAGLPKSTVVDAFHEGWGKQVSTLYKMAQAVGLKLSIEKT
jgi:DNA-binding phage protein